jgi:hypothetical protein
MLSMFSQAQEEQRRMYLRDLSIELSDRAVLPKGYTARRFHDSTHAVVEAYLGALPRRKVKVGEAAKVILYVGPRDLAEIGSEDDIVVLPDGVAFVWLSGVGHDLDVAQYAGSDRTSQQQMLLAALDGGLVAIARRMGGDFAALERVKQTLLAREFPLPEIREQELLWRWGLLSKPAKKRTAAVKRRGSKGERKKSR